MLSNVEERNYVRTQKNSGNTLHTGNANTTERSLLNILQHCEDLSIGSEEVEKKITDWSSRYYLSSKRVDILRPFTQHLRRKKILEIGGRSGTVTRFLGELECYVLSFEENADWIKVERERCRDLQNIKLVNDRIENCAADERFDFVILLETAELHNLGAADRLIRFNKIKNLLSPQGKLLLAIENKIGLKYWAGAPEIQGRAQYQTLQHPEAGENTTFSYHEMVSLLRESGFEIFQRMYPFPDHLFSDVIITDTGFKTKGFDPLELLFEKFEYFQHAKYNGQFSTTLAGATLFENDLLPQFANSFLLTAGLSPGSDAVEQNEILAYVYTTSRKKEYCKQTFFQCNPTTNEISVVRQSLYKQNTQNSHLLHQSLHQEPYMRGSVLLGSLLPVVSSAGWTIEDLVEWANRFNEIILSKSFLRDGQLWLEGKYIDLTPFNIIPVKGDAKCFDLEWICDENIPAYYVFFRGMIHSLARILFVNTPGEETSIHVIELAAQVTKNYFRFTDAELADCKERELKYFSPIVIHEMKDPFSINELTVRNHDYLEQFRMNEELSVQNSKLSSDLEAERTQLNYEISSHSETRKLAANLSHEISSLKNDVNWYVDTYVKRSIAGVIRQKLSDNQFSFLKRHKLSGSYAFTASHNILFDEEKSQYSASGSDPYFTIELNNENLVPGWYWLTLELHPAAGEFISSKLSFSTGTGFNETNVCFLPPPREGKITALVNFHMKVYQLRFHPSINECAFSTGKFSLRRISKFKALRKTIQLYKQSTGAQASESISKKLLLKFRENGIAGVRQLLRKMSQASITRVTPYMQWCARYDTLTASDLETLKKKSDRLRHQPFFSVIMPVYNPPLVYLQKAIESVMRQPYSNWELCIADDRSSNKNVKKILNELEKKDKRIKVAYRQVNGHISEASNTAVDLATGDFIVLLDQDDELSAHALYLVAEAINKYPDAALLYSDEDKIDEEGTRFNPYFKTDWNPDLITGQNMISHLGVYKTSIVKEIGGFRKGFEGSQDYDLALRFIEKINSSQIIHIPRVLYHWRAISGSTAAGMNNKRYAFTAGLKALESFVHNQDWSAEVIPNVYDSYRVKWKLPQKPKVSIIIPTKDKADVLSKCISGILDKTKYPDFEIIIVDNNSLKHETFETFYHFCVKDPRVSVVQYNHPFNFSAIINYGVSKCTGSVLVLLNNDTEVINAEWLEELVSHTMRKNVGAVGGKLLYPNGLIQHAGIFLYEGHPGIHIYQKHNSNSPGYFNKLNLVQNYSAVTAACLAVRKGLFEDVGGFDEKNLPVAYNDVDFCLRLREKGYYNVWTPFCQLYHHEFLSRGDDFNEANVERFKKEHRFMLNKWRDLLHSDPYFNPNLSPEPGPVSYANPPNVEYSWKQTDSFETLPDSEIVEYENAAHK